MNVSQKMHLYLQSKTDGSVLPRSPVQIGTLLAVGNKEKNNKKINRHEKGN